jgi:hypothetical protein
MKFLPFLEKKVSKCEIEAKPGYAPYCCRRTTCQGIKVGAFLLIEVA